MTTHPQHHAHPAADGRVGASLAVPVVAMGLVGGMGYRSGRVIALATTAAGLLKQRTAP